MKWYETRRWAFLLSAAILSSMVDNVVDGTLVNVVSLLGYAIGCMIVGWLFRDLDFDYAANRESEAGK